MAQSLIESECLTLNVWSVIAADRAAFAKVTENGAPEAVKQGQQKWPDFRGVQSADAVQISRKDLAMTTEPFLKPKDTQYRFLRFFNQKIV